MRDCCQVINQMLEKIPIDKIEFIKDLQWNYEDVSYKVPEETLQWNRTQSTLIKHISQPKENWEFEVLSIFTNKSVEEIQSDIENTSNEVQKNLHLLNVDNISFNYNLQDILNLKANAQFLKDKRVPIEAFGLSEFMNAVIKLADDCITLIEQNITKQ